MRDQPKFHFEVVVQDKYIIYTTIKIYCETVYFSHEEINLGKKYYIGV